MSTDIVLSQFTERQQEMLVLLMQLSEAASDLNKQIQLMDEALMEAYNSGMLAGAAAHESGDILPRRGRWGGWHTDPYVMG
jgi:hypothetical protein